MIASTDTRCVEEQERVELPETHFYSPESDPFFFPKRSQWKEKGIVMKMGWILQVQR